MEICRTFEFHLELGTNRYGIHFGSLSCAIHGDRFISTNSFHARRLPGLRGGTTIQSLRLRLRSGLRQSGSRFAVRFRRGAEAPLYLRSNGKINSKNKKQIQGSFDSRFALAQDDVCGWQNVEGSRGFIGGWGLPRGCRRCGLSIRRGRCCGRWCLWSRRLRLRACL